MNQNISEWKCFIELFQAVGDIGADTTTGHLPATLLRKPPAGEQEREIESHPIIYSALTRKCPALNLA
jgi:hypothetical protein